MYANRNEFKLHLQGIEDANNIEKSLKDVVSEDYSHSMAVIRYFIGRVAKDPKFKVNNADINWTNVVQKGSIRDANTAKNSKLHFLLLFIQLFIQ